MRVCFRHAIFSVQPTSKSRAKKNRLHTVFAAKSCGHLRLSVRQRSYFCRLRTSQSRNRRLNKTICLPLGKRQSIFSLGNTQSEVEFRKPSLGNSVRNVYATTTNLPQKRIFALLPALRRVFTTFAASRLFNRTHSKVFSVPQAKTEVPQTNNRNANRRKTTFRRFFIFYLLFYLFYHYFLLLKKTSRQTVAIKYGKMVKY